MSNTRDCFDADSTVFTGPFHGLPPLDLWQQLAVLPDGGSRSGDEVRTSAQAWLQIVLEEAGVELGDYDQEVITILAKDCVTTVQVVAGWISRVRPVL